MAKRDDSKIRLLAVERILLRGQKVTTQKILRELDLHYGICADRKTIMADICAIDRFRPVDSSPGPGGGYQIVDVLGRCGND